MKILSVEPLAGTGDRNVLAEVLEEMGEVTRVAVDPAAPLAEALRLGLAEPADLALFWRTEAVAAGLLAIGLRRAVIVPSMAPRAGTYWQQFAGAARFVSFSRRQHEALQAHECRSAYFDHWPQPAGAVPARDFAPEAWRAVFVDAEPGRGATHGPRAGMPTRGIVAQQCRHPAIPDLTIPNLAIADPAALPAPPRTAASEGGNEGEGESPAEIEAEAHFVFASPAFGLAPGIDHATRRAMGRGQIVVAPDVAPANETIGHLASGILFDPKRPTDLPALTAQTAERLSQGARARAEIGHRMWLEDRPRLISVLKDDGQRWVGSDPSAHLGNAIQQALHRRAGGA